MNYLELVDGGFINNWILISAGGIFLVLCYLISVYDKFIIKFIALILGLGLTCITIRTLLGTPMFTEYTVESVTYTVDAPKDVMSIEEKNKVVVNGKTLEYVKYDTEFTNVEGEQIRATFDKVSYVMRPNGVYNKRTITHINNTVKYVLRKVEY